MTETERATRATSVTAAWEAEMRSLFKRARFREASAIYDEAVAQKQRPLAETTILNAHALLTRDPAAALDFLSQHRLLASDPATRFQWSLFAGIAHARLRDFGPADKYFAAAVPANNSQREQAQLAYHITRRYLLEMRLNQAWKNWRGTLADKSTYGKIRSEHLRSFILSQEERYSEQVASLLSVLKLIGSNQSECLEEWYWAVQTLAVLARELPVPEANLAVERALNADVEWSPEFAVNRFQALKALGWCQALSGDQLGCFRYLRKAQELDVATQWKAVVLLDRSYLARSVGEKQWALNELLAADDLASALVSGAYADEARIALLLFAELFSAVDPRKAKQYLERFDSLPPLNSPLILGAFDRRFRAKRDYSAGVVYAALDSSEKALSSLRSAWNIFDSIGYDWRAARSAIRLLEASGKSRWRHLAEEKLESYPDSWFACELSVPSSNRRPPLPRMQQQVFERLCAGMSTDDIAKTLGRSQSTVRNHIKMIFKTFGVKSRHALVALAARENLIA